jgi:hypothetical protein
MVIQRQLKLIGAAAALAMLASRSFAQQTVPDQSVQAQPSTTDQPAYQAPPPPAYEPPAPAPLPRLPRHRYTKVPAPHHSAASHHASHHATAHRSSHRTSRHERAERHEAPHKITKPIAHAAAKTMSRCADMTYKQMLRHSTCRALVRAYDESTSAPAHRSKHHSKKAAHQRATTHHRRHR